jgi:hypothetical protein
MLRQLRRQRRLHALNRNLGQARHLEDQRRLPAVPGSRSTGPANHERQPPDRLGGSSSTPVTGSSRELPPKADRLLGGGSPARSPSSSWGLATEPTGHKQQHERRQISSIDAMGCGHRDQHGPLRERFRRQHAGGNGHQGKGQDSPARPGGLRISHLYDGNELDKQPDRHRSACCSSAPGSMGRRLLAGWRAARMHFEPERGDRQRTVSGMGLTGR